MLLHEHLTQQGTPSASTAGPIAFFRPAFAPPLIAEAVPLRAGRSLITYDVRIWSEGDGPQRLIAQANATWATTGAARER